MGNLNEFAVNWNEVEDSNFEQIPTGKYPVILIKSEIKVNKAETGKNIECEFKFLGKFKGRTFKTWLVMANANPIAVNIGRQKLKQIAVAVDVDLDEMADTSELHGIPLGVMVKTSVNEAGYDSIDPKYYFKYEDDLLNEEEEEAVSVDSVIEDAVMVEDEEEIILPESGEEICEKPDISPSVIKAFKKDELLAYIKENNLGLDLKGKKIAEIKDAVIDLLFNPTCDEEDDDIVIEGE